MLLPLTFGIKKPDLKRCFKPFKARTVNSFSGVLVSHIAVVDGLSHLQVPLKTDVVKLPEIVIPFSLAESGSLVPLNVLPTARALRLENGGENRAAVKALIEEWAPVLKADADKKRGGA
jgi:hypothetical protein